MLLTKLKNYCLVRIEHFTPPWFAAVMGIGISASILYTFPFQAHWLRVLGVILWGFAMGAFGIFAMALVLRVILFPRQATSLMLYPGHSVFLGCIPMGFATVINMVHNIWGKQAWKATYTMWWIDVFMSLFCAWGVVFVMFLTQKRTQETLNPTILLPVVALVVASATGSLIAEVQPSTLQPSSLIVSLLLLANGEFLAFAFCVAFINRLLVANLPDRTLTISLFLQVGPLGQGTFSILNATLLAADILTGLGVAADTINALKYLGILIGFGLMGFASFWMVMAFMALIVRYPSKFSLGWWGLTFPIGTYVLGWYRLATLTDLYSFKVLGALFGVLEVLFMILCFCLSIKSGILSDGIFIAAGNEITAWSASPLKSDSHSHDTISV
jgi:tellurite resistance protein TehA-like permease